LRPKVWAGLTNLLNDYVCLESDDTVFVLYTSDSAESAALAIAGLELRGIEAHRVWMAPLFDVGFADRLAGVLPSPDALPGRLVVLSFEKNTMSHSAALNAALRPYPRDAIRVLRAISSCEELFATAFQVTPPVLSALNTTLLERLVSSQHLRLETKGGTALNVEVDSKRHRWISNRGMGRPGGTVILPAGEVATYPASINGTHVADFAFNVNAITDQDARLEKTPVTVWIEDGRAVDFRCDSAEVTRFLGDCFHKHCAFNVGELGFGTNVAIHDAIAMNSHINERRPGVHIGFGQHNQDPGVVGYQCSIHLDLIASGGLVWIDDDPTPLNLEDIAASSSAHPFGTRDEDVFSPEAGVDIEVDDCCGIVTAEGLQLFDCPT
jgi:hypothetical protein